MQMNIGHWLLFAALLIGGYYVGRNYPLNLPVIG